MIHNFRWAGNDYRFISPTTPVFPHGSSYTVIVGKNGTGKSRLLRQVVRSALGASLPPEALEREERLDRGGVELPTQEGPTKVICVSTSPFDKFPTLKRGIRTERYAYLGLRGLPSQNLGLAYLSKIMAVLLSSIYHHPDRSEAVARVLQYLNYAPKFRANFALSLPPSALRDLASRGKTSEGIREAIDHVRTKRVYSSDGGFAQSILNDATEAQLHEISASLMRFEQNAERGRLDVVFNDGVLMPVTLEGTYLPDALKLLDVGLLRLRSVELRKAGGDDWLRINDASSGEQSVVLSLLGVASHIQPGALICIDEPEVCLHPEWQQKYIDLLISLFDRYPRCQFLIATHSPQIVAELDQSNCFVLTMEDREIHSASSYAHRSADFQLARVFRAPGRSNEYLVRIALSLLAIVGRRKAFNSEDLQTLDFLRSIRPELSEADPASELIESVEQMAARYARNS